MQISSKLILLIHSFTPKETEQFKKFISSPFFAKGRNYLPFLELVLKVKKMATDNDKESLIISEERKQLSEQTLRNRYSELYYLAEAFLTYKGFTENKTEMDKVLLRKLREKKLDKLFRANYTKTLKHLNSEKFDDIKFQDLSYISGLQANFLHDHNKIDAWYKEYYTNSKIVLCIKLLSIFEMGLEFTEQQSDNRIYESNYVFDFLRKLDTDDIMKTFKKSDSIILKVTSMNYYLYKAFEDPEIENNYFVAYRMFIELSDELKEDYKINIFTHLINYSIRKQNEGVIKFQKELFKLYNEKLRQNLISDLKSKNYLFNGFRDYVYIGMNLREYKWVENFIEKFSSELPNEIRDSEIKLSYARLNFQRKDFEKSLSNLDDIKVTNYLQYLDSSLIKLANYYELARYEEAYLEIDKQKHYLKYHKEIPKDRIRFNINFITIYKKLLNITLHPERKNTGYLEKELKQVKYIEGREWLLRKITELK